ncbi:hypothetical protein E2562_028717 [Oryza meyeriana var. granulata]|uniref:Uncharacterized protein n=1 Tax=Oryza meyeriana var. granulata TaxID=110450 RepID=A0A6G1DAQ8_9ORYZ|nr:hypothetical protein E2562_028717 [Oryza meyeriana var. granulata]
MAPVSGQNWRRGEDRARSPLEAVEYLARRQQSTVFALGSMCARAYRRRQLRQHRKSGEGEETARLSGKLALQQLGGSTPWVRTANRRAARFGVNARFVLAARLRRRPCVLANGLLLAAPGRGRRRGARFVLAGPRWRSPCLVTGGHLLAPSSAGARLGRGTRARVRSGSDREVLDAWWR